MSTPTRWIVVDDTDPNIQYTGAWFPANGTLNNLGQNGPPFQGTSQGVNTSASFSFTFSGSRVQVVGFSQINDDPGWACFVDGVGNGTVNFKDGSKTSSNNWVLCEVVLLPDMVHTLTVQATVLDPRNTFWFDRINYIPSTSVPPDNTSVYVDSSDPAIQYGSGWGPLRDIAEMTQENGAHMSFDFVGVQLSWFSMIPSNIAIGQAPATYSIDGGAPVVFLLAGLTAGAGDQYNQLFFHTPLLSPGSHHLEVVYNGNAQMTPLSLDYLVIQNATVPGSASNGSSSISSSGSPNNTASPKVSLFPNSMTKPKVPTGAIVGGVVGGILVIVALVFLIIFRLRARKRKVIEGYDKIELATPQITVEPFNDFPSAPAQQQQPAPSGDLFFPSNTFQTTGKVVRSTLAPQPLVPSPSGTQSQAINSNSSTNTPQNYGPSTSTAHLLVRSKKAAERMTNNGVAVTTTPSGGSTSLQSGTSPETAGVLRHEDSGVRLPAQGEQTLLEQPPLYTPE